MSMDHTFIKFSVALSFSMFLLPSSAFGQVLPTQPNPQRTKVAATQVSRLGNAEVVASDSKLAKPESTPATTDLAAKDVKDELDNVKADNVAVRELLRKMEEQ